MDHHGSSLQIEEDPMTAAEPAEPRRGLETVTADRQFLRDKHHQLRDGASRNRHRTGHAPILECSARQEQAQAPRRGLV
jgi:hypothetical protein